MNLEPKYTAELPIDSLNLPDFERDIIVYKFFKVKKSKDGFGFRNHHFATIQAVVKGVPTVMIVQAYIVTKLKRL